MSEDVWLPIPAYMVAMGDRLGIIVDEDLVAKALRQYLYHIKRTRKHHKEKRTNPKTRDEWYRKRREDARVQRKDKETKIPKE